MDGSPHSNVPQGVGTAPHLHLADTGYSLRTCTRPRALVLVCIPPRALPGVTGQLTGAWGQNMGCLARQLERAGGKYQKGCRLCPVWPQTWYTTQNHLCPLRPQRVTPGSWFLKWSLRNTARQQRATLSGDVLFSQGCHKAPQPGRLETTDMYYLRSGS